MNPSYANALSTASQACSSQDFPNGCLFVVATPIGNLADITLRAIHTLSLCDYLACEDTRESKNLLNSYGIDKPHGAWIALHQHNESELSPQIITKLEQGARIAFLCDAGTPSISDPGAWLVHCVQTAGFKVVPIPGVSSVTTLLSVSGLMGQSGFHFLGFLSTKATERDRQIKSIEQTHVPTVLLEAPHRIEALAQSLSCLGHRHVTVGRELTKQYEQIITLPADQLSTWLGADRNRTRGEFALIVHVSPQAAQSDTAPYVEILKVLLSELSLKGSVKLAQLLTGASKNELYNLALNLTKDGDTGSSHRN